MTGLCVQLRCVAVATVGLLVQGCTETCPPPTAVCGLNIAFSDLVPAPFHVSIVADGVTGEWDCYGTGTPAWVRTSGAGSLVACSADVVTYGGTPETIMITITRAADPTFMASACFAPQYATRCWESPSPGSCVEGTVLLDLDGVPDPMCQ